MVPSHFVSPSLNQVVSLAPDKKPVALLFSFPIGKLWARYLPNVVFFGVSLNPGPFTIKEHVIIVIMAGIGSEPAYAVSPLKWQIMLAHLLTLTVIRRTLSRLKGSSTISILASSVSF